MSEVELTVREREYLDCDTPTLTRGQTAKGLTIGFLIGLLQAAFAPGMDKGDKKLLSTGRLMRYTRYKKAVLRKQAGTPKKGDDRLLIKLNKKPFALEYESFDADEYTRKMYEEYLDRRGGS